MKKKNMTRGMIALGFFASVFTTKAQVSAFGNIPTTPTNGNSMLGSTHNVVQTNSYGCLTSGWGNTISGSNEHQLHLLGAQNTVSTSNLSNSFILGYNSSLTQSNAFVFGNSSSVTGSSAFYIGNNGSSSGSTAFAMGNNNAAQGVGSFAIGNYCTAASQNSMAFGTFCTAAATNSFVIGSGLSTNFATNNNANSLMVTFNNTSASTRPTFFVTEPNTVNSSTYDNYGTVGIGTNDTKGHTLGVRGDIIAEKIQVSLYSTPWPDFVFAKDYELLTVKSVEKYIAQFHHLPGVPEAKIIESQGYDLADMDAVLLKKVEELTLYIIDLKNENEAIKKELESLKN